jgi:hypothetical protein
MIMTLQVSDVIVISDTCFSEIDDVQNLRKWFKYDFIMQEQQMFYTLS